MSTLEFTTMSKARSLAASLFAALAFSVLAVGCAPDEDPTEEAEVIDSAQEELISPTEIVVGEDDFDGDALDDVRKDQQGESEQGFASPGDVRAEPVPHPWVPKSGSNDNDT